jgi:hypothetical protein
MPARRSVAKMGENEEKRLMRTNIGGNCYYY